MNELKLGSGKWVFVDWLGIDPGYGTSWGGGSGDGFHVPEGIELKAHVVSAEPEPVMRADEPWENALCAAYAGMLYDEGLYRCWYEPYYWRGNQKVQSGIAYAESDDGLAWRKPRLGLTEFAGSSANNLVDLGERGWAHAHSVMKDPAALPDARYKMVSCGCDPERTIATAVSPDGLRWKFVEPILTGNNSDTQNVLHYNAASERYVLYTRQTNGVLHRRGVNRTESPVCGNFPPSTPVVESSPLDAPDFDIYCSGYNQWPGAADAHVMRMTAYRHTADTMDVVLATSRDETLWHRPLGTAPWVLPPAAPRLRMESVYACGGIVPGGAGQWSTYVAALNKGHNAPTEAYGTAFAGEGLLRVPMREDGFMSLSAAGHGQFWTVPFQLRAAELRINVRTGYSGYFKCEVLEAGLGETGEAVTEGSALPGYTLEDSCPIVGDAVDAPVAWRGGSLGALCGKSIRLRIVLYKADLYALKFASSRVA